MNLITGKSKQFNTILARSGVGKTVLAYLLIKKYQKPTLILDTFNQFQGNKMSFSKFLELSTNREFLEDFYKYNHQIIIDSKVEESEFIIKNLLSQKRFKNMLIFIDEIDLFLQSDRVSNKHSFYEFVNRGRHKEFYLITTARSTANIPKTLIAQTDFFYISNLIEKGALDFVENTLKGLDLKKTIEDLKPYEFLKINVNKKIVQRFKSKIEWLDYFSQKN